MRPRGLANLSQIMLKRILTALLIVGAVLSIALSLLGLVAGRTWPAELATHFRVQYLAAQLLMALGLTILGHGRWLYALLPAALLNAVLIGPYLLPQTVSAASGSAPLKLLEANLAVFNRSLDGLLRIVQRENPDVILLLEYTPLAETDLQPLRETYRFSTQAAQIDPFGIALLSRLPLHDAKTFQLGTTLAVDARLDAPGGPVRLLGVHLQPPVTATRFEQRNAQLQALATLANERREPLIVFGDFNLSPYSPYFRAWLSEARLRDTLLGRGLDFSWPGYFVPLGIPIDHFAVSQEFSVLTRRRLENFGSDHLPVLVELSQDDANE